MIRDRLLRIVEENKTITNQLFLRSLLKEVLQDYVLNFSYNHSVYKELIFTGGSCLRRIYGLPRLSEDVDFDFIGEFDLTKFSKDISEYFAKKLRYKNLTIKENRQQNTLYLKFPLLKDLGLVKKPTDTPLLFLRCDFAKEEIGVFETEVNPISTEEFSFFVRSYDLPTLFANKIIAFLEREFFKGKKQALPFKGRDVFDLVWFFEKAAKGDFSLEPNWERVFKKLKINSKQEILRQLVIKLEKIDRKSLQLDLLPFIESSQALENFSQNYLRAIKTKLKYFSLNHC